MKKCGPDGVCSKLTDFGLSCDWLRVNPSLIQAMPLTSLRVLPLNARFHYLNDSS